MRPEEKEALRIGAFCVLVPIVSGALVVFLGQAIKDSLVMSWTIGGLLLTVGVFAGSVPLFRLNLTRLKKVLLIFGYLIFSFAVFVYTVVLVVCYAFNDCL